MAFSTPIMIFLFHSNKLRVRVIVVTGSQHKYRNTEDAIIILLEMLYSHLERTRFGNSFRVMFFDFSSAFNTIQPHLLVKKLLDINVPCGLIRWTLDYLTNRSQYVNIGQSSISNVIFSSKGAPQGTVLAPFLFTLYTSDCRSQSSKCPLIKFADDTALIDWPHQQG